MTDGVLASQILAFAALVAATVEYRQILRRRAIVRRAADWQRVASEAGLRGLVRVFLAEH